MVCTTSSLSILMLMDIFKCPWTGFKLIKNQALSIQAKVLKSTSINTFPLNIFSHKYLVLKMKSQSFQGSNLELKTGDLTLFMLDLMDIKRKHSWL